MVDRHIMRNYMHRAIELAALGKGRTGTNPMVGAVLVKDGRIIGEGYHRCFGGDHAEIDAIKNATEPIAGAELYVNLEPCSHHGKTPPCADALKTFGIKRVVTAMPDPNPLVNGAGLRILEDNKIEVETGIELLQAEKLNRAYFKYLRTGLPWVILKIAQTLDGKIADLTGNSKWITSDASRGHVHLLRSQVDAVIIGAGTARHDNPSLTTHGASDHDPIRIVVGTSRTSVPESLDLVANCEDRRTIVVTPGLSDSITVANGGPSKVNEWTIESQNNTINLEKLLRVCAAQHMGRVLVEGGASVFTQFIEAGLVDEITFVIAPRLLGRGLPAFDSTTERRISETLQLKLNDSFEIGGDLWIETEVVN